MKRTLLYIGAVFLMSFCALTSMAEVIAEGYYRVHNAQYPSDYIGLANDKFSYHSIIGSATQAANSANWPWKISFATAYLKNDVHVFQDTAFISPGTLIYIQAKDPTDNNNTEYNLIAQGTSLHTLATGNFTGSYSGYFPFTKWVVIKKVSGSGDNAKYTASIQLKDDRNNLDLGFRYFRDEIVNGKSTFSICGETEITEDAHWQLEPVTYFNVAPNLEYNGKYYTTLKVPFKWQIAEGSSVEKIYVITDATNGFLQQQEITGIVPEGTPVILECSSNNPIDCKLQPIGIPKFSPANVSNQSAPAADEASYYSGTNLLKGTYYCNTDGTVYYYNADGTKHGSINGNHYTAATNPQKFVLGFGDSGHFGFKPATANIPANTVWMEEQAEYDTDVAMPIFSIPRGTYNSPQTVSISCATEGATIYYTTNGNKPTTSSAVYSTPIAVNKTNTTIKAVAIKDGHMSAIASHAYVIQVLTPTISLAAGTYTGPRTVTLSCATEGATIRYTTNGSTPSTSSTIYTGPITVDRTMTLKARAFLTNWTASGTASAAYKITNVIANPTSLTINESGTSNTFNVNGYLLNLGWSSSSNRVNVTNSNSSFSTTLTATTGTASTTYFAPNSDNGSLVGKVAMTYNGRLLKDNCTITLTYAYNTSIKATVNVNYVPDIYIVTDNGVTNQWNFDGAKMTNNNGVYTATFIAPADNTYILFSRKASLASNEQWNTRYVFGPNSNNDWVMPSNVATATGNIDVNDDDPIKLPYAGEYTITINANESNYPFTITRKIETVATPTIAPPGGTYDTEQSVTIECTTPGATIRYTTDGSEPTVNSQAYSGPISIREGTTTIRAIATKDGWNNSAEVSATYNIVIPEIPSEISLADLQVRGELNKPYHILDDLIGTWASANGNMLWAKDENRRPNDVRPSFVEGQQIDYLRDTPMHYTDNNGVTQEYFWQTLDWDQSDWIALDFTNITGVSASDCMGKKISHVIGNYTDNVDFTIQLTEEPSISEEPIHDYPDANTAYQNPANKDYDWHYNTYIPANFYTSNYNKEVDVNVVEGFLTHDIQTDKDVDLYFMNPKIHEVARIWGVWNQETQSFTVYSTSWYNHFEPRISGAVSAIWDYNINGDISISLTTGDAYCFHAVVTTKPRSRFTADGPTASGDAASNRYAIHPLDFRSAEDNFTTLRELNMNLSKEVESVQYYNVLGMMSDKPFDGLNIIVTRYTDGTSTAIKVIR